jgi:hypothetical protein
MAVSVAPLTTVVMSAVEQNRAGTASGINNAVARVAGLLAVAILGIVMVSAFSSHIKRSVADLQLSPDSVQNLQSNETKLAALAVPVGIDPSTAVKITSAIDQSFVFGFRLVMLICAAMSVVSALFAWQLIAVRSKQTSS